MSSIPVPQPPISHITPYHARLGFRVGARCQIECLLTQIDHILFDAQQTGSQKAVDSVKHTCSERNRKHATSTTATVPVTPVYGLSKQPPKTP